MLRFGYRTDFIEVPAGMKDPSNIPSHIAIIMD
ncbi:unnamed protein product, partial [marine sediment metagenome]